MLDPRLLLLLCPPLPITVTAVLARNAAAALLRTAGRDDVLSCSQPDMRDSTFHVDFRNKTS